MQTNFIYYFLFCIFNLNLLVLPIAGQSNDEKLVISVHQVDQGDRILRKIAQNSKNEVILENIEGVRLECSGKRPLQWIYQGEGTPLYKIMSTFTPGRTRSDGDGIFKSSIFIHPLKEAHSGKYKCSDTSESPETLNFVQVYVPGPNVFVSNQLNVKSEILLPQNGDMNGQPVIIPCSVSSPHYIVRLEKIYQGLSSPVNSGANFDPSQGFILILSYFPRPEGKYICNGRNNQGVQKKQEYLVKRNVSSEFEDGLKLEGEGQKCEKHTDCPTNLVCLYSNQVDLICKDPCAKLQAGCGRNSLCKVEYHTPMCSCPPNYPYGDPKEECLRNRPQKDQPKSDKSENKDGPPCETHTDCPDNMSCYVDRVCRDTCKNSVVGCGKDSLCRVENHNPICYCPRDYDGDPKKECFKGLQGDEGFSTSQRSRPRPEPLTSTIASNSNRNDAKNCRSNTDCRNPSLMCRDSKCVDKCESKLCGIGAECFVTSGLASCRCQPGLFGNPNKECIPDQSGDQNVRPEKIQNCSPQSCQDGTSCPCDIVDKIGRDCVIDENCGDHLRCQTTARSRKCADPCDLKLCLGDSICKVKNHRAVCEKIQK